MKLFWHKQNLRKETSAHSFIYISGSKTAEANKEYVFGGLPKTLLKIMITVKRLTLAFRKKRGKNIQPNNNTCLEGSQDIRNSVQTKKRKLSKLLLSFPCDSFHFELRYVKLFRLGQAFAVFMEKSAMNF